jgi:hypothetical protein
MRKKLTDEEALAAVRKAGETGDFEMAQQDSLERYPEEGQQICEALSEMLSIRVGFLSDMSALSDFPTERVDAFYEKLGDRLCVPVAHGDSVVEVCRRMREKAKAGRA